MKRGAGLDPQEHASASWTARQPSAPKPNEEHAHSGGDELDALLRPRPGNSGATSTRRARGFVVSAWPATKTTLGACGTRNSAAPFRS